VRPGRLPGGGGGDPAHYEEIRAEPDRFLVARGHERDDIEVVLEHREDYSVVRKVGEAGDLAAASDPRS
jgi:hypothetical protein